MLGEPAHRQGGRAPWRILAALLLVAAVTGAVWLSLRRSPGAPAKSSAELAVRPAPSTATPLPTSSAINGTLQVDVEEPDARVELDGEAAGPAPLTRDLPPGSHRVRVTKPGREAWEREVQIVPGHTAHLTARLEREPARLRVVSDVPGANVFLDRKFLGTTPIETRDVGSGSHRLNVSAEGYEMYSETLDLGTGPREVVVRFKEVRLDEKLAVVHKHGMGSCRGTLLASTAGLRYDTPEAGDAFSAPFASLEPLQVDYLKKILRVRLRGGRTYNFTSESADALLSFQKAVEAARKRL